MLEKVEKYIVDNNLITEKDKILIGVSGGPDSICLLHILNSLKSKLDIEIGAIHINHLLRGEEANGDEDYVRRVCKSIGIKFYCKHIDIKSLSKSKGISIEMAGREARYEAFNKVRISDGYNKIAVAHNMNDQAETILMRIMRGTGIEGLTGMKPIRDGYIIRPILCMTRDEIEKYCDENSLNPRIDPSNLEREYSRNRVRLDIIPYMKEYFNDDILSTINRMASMLQKDNEFIEIEAEKVYKEVCVENDSYINIKSDLLNYHISIQTRVIKMALINLSKTYMNFEMKHIYNVLNFIRKGVNGKIDLPNQIFLEVEYGVVRIRKRVLEEHSSLIHEEVRILRDDIDEKEFNFKDFIIKFKIISNKKIEFSNNDLIKYFDYDKIEESILIRNRKNGDKIKPLGLKGSKKLKDIFIDLKIPKDERDNIPLVCSGEDILWIVGYKVSEEFKITKDTKNILKITFSRKGY